MKSMTEEEQRTYKLLTTAPENYPVPKGGKRVCYDCGAEFEDVPGTKEVQGASALQQLSDHLGIHNPSPAQWATAHERIEAGKERAKRNT